jgi:putative phosphoribosyl transferase
LTEVEIELEPGLRLAGDLQLPAAVGGLVIFAHGSGSSRLSPRNRQVAEYLNHAGQATVLFDLLTGEEELDRSNVFDIGLLAERLVAVTCWASDAEKLASLPVGYFGASTGAAAALSAAARLGDEIHAIVSRGGRPDLAAESIPAVRAPTLLIVGGADRQVLELNKKAATLLRGEREVAVVPGATHLFEEPGALERVAELAADWFSLHLRSSTREPGQG